MGLSSSIGSNTFDILLCLGLPWLVKTWFYPKIPHTHSIIINSSGLTYSAISLLTTLVMFYLSLLFNRFKWVFLRIFFVQFDSFDSIQDDPSFAHLLIHKTIEANELRCPCWQVNKRRAAWLLNLLKRKNCARKQSVGGRKTKAKNTE